MGLGLWLLLIAVGLVAGAIALAWVPIALRLNLQGRGEWSKSWVLAGGLELGPVALSVAAGKGIDGLVQVHLFGRRLFKHTLLRKKPQAPKPTTQAAASGPQPDPLQLWVQQATEFKQRVERWVPLEELAAFALSQRHKVQVRELQGRLAYSTPDVAWTGMLSGFLYTAAGLLSPVGTVQIEPQWEDVAKAEGRLKLAVRFWPLRLGASALLFALQSVHWREQTVAQPPGSAPTLRLEGPHGR